ncbi:hypothetical protein UFOVP816_13 [uncultured Caudovirales phage]|uniref:Uncharacterized protein n=1 Tax=uncultured Caudovirales phage TaxID=2100421 RepID=A0A6J5P4M8_9CAUD|nr:hypothetical protein UFOVP816_13 [uncultured Caudovirales phage]
MKKLILLLTLSVTPLFASVDVEDYLNNEIVALDECIDKMIERSDEDKDCVYLFFYFLGRSHAIADLKEELCKPALHQ